MKKDWDSSDEVANLLKPSDFGPPDRLKKISRMDRFPKSYAEAREIMSGFVGQPFVSVSGLHSTLSRNSIEKILSNTSGKDVHNLKSHLMAAGNLDKLYTNAIEPWEFELNPNKHNENITSVHRLYAPMEYEGQTAIVKITVKEMKNPKDGNRIYSIKALNVFLNKK
jgi:hypothetical protein